MNRCRSCKAPIIWALTPRGKRIPLEPNPNGNIVLDRIPFTGDLGATFLHPGQTVDEDHIRYVAHFATCPNAATHRARRPAA